MVGSPFDHRNGWRVAVWISFSESDVRFTEVIHRDKYVDAETIRSDAMRRLSSEAMKAIRWI